MKQNHVEANGWRDTDVKYVGTTNYDASGVGDEDQDDCDDDDDDDDDLITEGESVQEMHPTHCGSHREGQTLALTCHYEAIIVMMKGIET